MAALANWVVYSVLHLSHSSRLAGALSFFVGDTIKIFLMLVIIIYGISVVRSFFPPERARKLLGGGRRQIIGNILAALLGIVTPFCSCSAVPVFIGFLETGIPLGVTLSFLISSPMVNEVALVMLLGLCGWKIALLYIGTGLIVAITAGFTIGHLNMENQVQDYVYEIRTQAAASSEGTTTWLDRHHYALGYAADIIRRVWIYVLVGIAIGGFIHGYAPEGLLARYAGPETWYAVPLAVLIGVPLYSNAAGTIPIVEALLQKGMPIGTALAFMMAVTALSFPEFVILKQVIKPKLMAIIISILAISIIIVGYLFNAILAS